MKSWNPNPYHPCWILSLPNVPVDQRNMAPQWKMPWLTLGQSLLLWQMPAYTALPIWNLTLSLMLSSEEVIVSVLQINKTQRLTNLSNGRRWSPQSWRESFNAITWQVMTVTWSGYSTLIRGWRSYRKSIQKKKCLRKERLVHCYPRTIFKDLKFDLLYPKSDCV